VLLVERVEQVKGVLHVRQERKEIPSLSGKSANRRRTLPLSEGRFAAKCPLSPQKWRPPSSNRKKSFAEIQKTEGKPCRDLDQGEAISTLIEYQGRISIIYAVSRYSAFQAAQRAFRSNRLSHEIGRRNLPRGKRLLPFAKRAGIKQAQLTKLASIRILTLVILEYMF
jgi:hypothetical protein